MAVTGNEVNELRLSRDADGNSLGLAYVTFAASMTNHEVIKQPGEELICW